MASNTDAPVAQKAGKAKAKDQKKRLTITKDGTVVDGAHLPTGSISVKADDVTIKNTTVRVRSGATTASASSPEPTGTKITSHHGQLPGASHQRHRVRQLRRAQGPRQQLPQRLHEQHPQPCGGDQQLDRRRAVRNQAANTVVTPTTVPTPVPDDGGSGQDASNTGVPAGTTLRPSGGMTITEDGAVLCDSMHVQGSITIEGEQRDHPQLPHPD